MADLASNPFAILTAVAAPAVLTNACSVLSLGTANRIARVVDQSRALAATKPTLTPGQRPAYERQLSVLERRGTMLLNALRIIYGALGSFAATALIAVVGAALAANNVSPGFEIAALIGFSVGSGGVIALVTGCTILVREARLAITMLAEELAADHVGKSSSNLDEHS